MNKNKLIYEAPEAQTFVIRFEGNILSVATQGNRINDATIDEWSEEL